MSEKLRILEMLDQDKITVEEANQLLQAAQDDSAQASKERELGRGHSGFEA